MGQGEIKKIVVSRFNTNIDRRVDESCKDVPVFKE
jgi:hypothetical protein